MPLLNGHEVRHRAAELAPPIADTNAESGGVRSGRWYFLWLSVQSGIPLGTIHNATRDHNPQGISLPRVYALAEHLRRRDEDIRAVVSAICVSADLAAAS